MNDLSAVEIPNESTTLLPIADTPRAAARLESLVEGAIIPPQGQCVDGRGGTLARRRYQNGCLFIRGKRKKLWVGQWREDFVEPNGTVRRRLIKRVIGSVSDYPTQKLATRQLQSVLSKINSPDYRPYKAATFGEFSTLWSERVLAMQKPSTIRAANSHLRCHLVKYFGQMNLDIIGQETVQQFVSSVAKDLSRHTITNLLCTLGSILKTAREWGYNVAEVKSGALAIPSDVLKKQPAEFTTAQVHLILGKAEEPWRTLFLLAATTGMRAGELLGLQVGDVDFDTRVIRVRRSTWYGKVQTVKTKQSVRTLPMPDAVASVLKTHIATRPSGADTWLFVTRNNRPPSSNDVVEHHLWPVLDALGIPHCGLHAFRHTQSSTLVSEGAPITVAQAQLGHTDPRVTLGIYSHVVPSQQREYAEKTAGVLIPKDATLGVVVQSNQ
jgi:integrase